MVEIEHVVVERDTCSHTGDTTYTDIDEDTGGAVAEITSGNFTTGGEYLILVNALISGDTIATSGIKLTHGATPTDFDGSEFAFEHITTTSKQRYTWFTVWTAASGEGIKLQYKTFNGSATVSANAVSLVAMRLDTDLTENVDWHFDDNTTDTTLTTSYSSTNNASVTVDSGDHGVGDTHLILATAQLDETHGARQHFSRITRTGEAVQSFPEVSIEGEDTTNGIFNQYMVRAIDLGAASNTFTCESRIETSTGDRFYSAVFVLNLEKFKVSAAVETTGEVALTTTDWDNTIQTLTFDLSGEGATRDSLVFGYFIGDIGGFNFISARMQLGGSDIPTDQTIEPQTRAYDATDEFHFGMVSLPTALAASSHTIDIEGHAQGTSGTPGYANRVLAAFTMELAAAGPAGFAHSIIPAVIG